MKKLIYILLFLPLFVIGQTDSIFTSVVTDQVFVVPMDVTSISVFSVQGGGGGFITFGGKGGNTALVTNLMVTPGETLLITVGSGGIATIGATGHLGKHSYIKRGITIIFSSTGTGSTSNFTGGTGGLPTTTTTPGGDVQTGGGGGGTAGYTENGTAGGGSTSSSASNDAASGGAWHPGYILTGAYHGFRGYGGGGIGILGAGSPGAGSSTVGRGGSSGSDGGTTDGGNFGGGGGGGEQSNIGGNSAGGDGANGALRITYSSTPEPEPLPIPPTLMTQWYFFSMLAIPSTVDLLTGLVSVWEFNESSGNAADAHGSNTMTMSGVLYSQSTVANLGTSFKFDGSNDFGASGIKPNINTFSISIWVSTTNTNSQGFITTITNTGTDRGGFSIQYGGGEFRILVYNSGGIVVLNSSIATDNSSMYHIVLTYDNGTCKFYVDRVLKETNTSVITSFHDNMYVGRYFSNLSTTNIASGRIDQPVVTDAVWDQTQVDEIYQSGSGLAYINFK